MAKPKNMNRPSVQPGYGKELKKIRLLLGESFQQFANRCEVDKKTIIDLEQNGRIPGLDTHLFNILAGLGKHAEEFEKRVRFPGK